MRTFFKIVFGSCLGSILALIVLVLILVGIGSAVPSVLGAKGKKVIESNSVLELNFDNIVPEKTNNIESRGFDFENKTTVGLADILKLIKNAKTDNSINGIFLQPGSGAALGPATLKDINDALLDFKSSKKFIYAYLENTSKSGYYLASVADKIFLNPSGSIEWRGNALGMMYFKNMLDQLNIKMNIFYVGKFKSATEPFRSDKMSPENRQQLKIFLNEYNDQFISTISTNRNIDPATLKQLAYDLNIETAEDALKYKMVDQLAYQDEAMQAIKSKLKIGDDKKINFTSINDYYDATTFSKDYSAANKIAVVYAEGEINDSDSDEGQIGSKKYIQTLRKIRYDNKVKAVVLRINSPGGSAYGSEQIWHEIEMIKKSGKKVIVSMGDYAASGGYYIACNADRIFANPNTITGSIGVFGMIPDISGFLKNKLYITTDTVQTGPNSLPISVMIPLSPTQREKIQKSIERIYDIFTNRVAEGRKIPINVVDSLAQGRIYSGNDGLKLRLVDEIGNLDKAIQSAAELSKVKDYRIVEFPETKEPMMKLIERLTGKSQDDDIVESAVNKEIGKIAPEYLEAKKLIKNSPYQTRIPFIIKF